MIKEPQSKLKDSEQELTKKLEETQAELNNKKKELEEAGNENKEKSALIEELKKEIDNLQRNADNYKKQIDSINAELATLRTNFDNNKQTTTEQTTTQDTTVDNISKQTTTEQTTKQPNENTESSQINIYSYDGFLLVLNKLLDEVKDTKNGISKKGLSKAGKKGMNDTKNKLKQYEDVLKGKKKTLIKQNKSGKVEIYENDITHIKNLFEELNNARKEIGMNQWGEYTSIANYLYNSPEIAKKSNKRQAKDLEFNQNFQKELKEGAILNIFNGNVQEANEFFRRIAEGEYTQADYQLYIQYSNILNPCCRKYGINIPVDPRLQSNGGIIETTQGNPNNSVDYSNMDRGETFQQGGLAGIIDKSLSFCSNMTPGQKNTWKSIAVLGGVAAGIFGLYKFYTSKKIGFWGKALTTGGVILGSQMLTGEGPISLFQRFLTGGFTKEYLESRFGNMFGNAVNGLGNSGIESSNTITPAMYSMMIFNPTTTVGEIRTLTSSFKDHHVWTEFREDAIRKLKNKYGVKSTEFFSATFSDNFDEQKRKNRLASFGVTDSIPDNTNVYEVANNASMNEIILEKFKEENGLKVKSNKKNELNDYMNNLKVNNQALNIETLNNHIDWFDIDPEATYTAREVDITFKNTMETQIDSLGIDDTKKSELKKAMKKFYDERTLETKPNLNNFSLSVDNGLLILTSHSGQKTEIDINKGELVDFGHRFSDLSELLNVAYLSNKILNSQEGKIPKDLPPFQYKRERKGICFNDATSILQDIITRDNSGMDTRVLSTGRGGATNKIENLSEYPKDYAAYLSQRREKMQKNSIDWSKYPTIKGLSESGITFINEQEVKHAEVRLNKIKEMRSMSNIGTSGYKPFSIEGNKLVFSTSDTQNTTKLYFPDQFPNDFDEKSMDLSNFPSLMENKDKFLNYMNDKNNKMRGSKLSQ